MDQPFIYKYRPKKLKDFEMSNTIIELLETLIDSDILNILLVGNSGSGKSSLINCIIKSYYNDNYSSENILTINSLKDQGISYYRSDVKTFCQTMCTIPNRKKIVILDDIDYINEQSQQVFRNCIDKYSKNVCFIASCSNIQKVIDSYQSRVLIIKIKPVEILYLNNIINKICIIENIEIEDKAKEFILSLCNNLVRTLISYLEKFKLLNILVTYDIAVNTCTNISFNDFNKYIKLCIDNDLSKAVELLYNIYDRGYSVIDILDNLYLFVKTTDILEEESKYIIIKYICKYITIFYNIHENEIELALLTNNLITYLKK
ncbi:replication factor C small subunit [Chrysochromulina ericina virus CeV-01B]|uniref:Replication factor C small subunit n=1 Tax=Chrysochromulina ericina virus CeV-01B TaxID=3070830 RepID=A0A0N9R0E7_9VIRU|nr:replication factor C small subunit [Chrysochromulina ericina virus]ALH22956.1 replication factor C small subunit [Chrysochromulina ericina virus CeV-01B]|tara:strand:+ start:3624 stop:4577 length:954 start_codon:yes stop_codon:yes gene_type:complete